MKHTTTMTDTPAQRFRNILRALYLVQASAPTTTVELTITEAGRPYITGDGGSLEQLIDEIEHRSLQHGEDCDSRIRC